MTEKHQNHQQARAAIVRRMEKAERDGDRAAWDVAKAERDAHDRDREWDDAKTAGDERRAQENRQRQASQMREQNLQAALALVGTLERHASQEASGADTLTAAHKGRVETMGKLQRIAEDLGFVDFNFNGLALSFDADLANRMTTMGVSYVRGQRYGQPPEAVLNPDIIATIRQRLSMAMED